MFNQWFQAFWGLSRKTAIPNFRISQRRQLVNIGNGIRSSLRHAGWRNDGSAVPSAKLLQTADPGCVPG
jgi:hypothetical protein